MYFFFPLWKKTFFHFLHLLLIFVPPSSPGPLAEMALRHIVCSGPGARRSMAPVSSGQTVLIRL